MRQHADSYLFPGAFAPILSLDELQAGVDDGRGNVAFDLPDPAPLADEHLENAQRQQAVHAYIGTLSSRDQHIVRRHFWDDASQTEIASELGVSRMAVCKALARIEDRARAALSDVKDRAPIN